MKHPVIAGLSICLAALLAACGGSPAPTAPAAEESIVIEERLADQDHPPSPPPFEPPATPEPLDQPNDESEDGAEDGPPAPRANQETAATQPPDQSPPAGSAGGQTEAGAPEAPAPPFNFEQAAPSQGEEATCALAGEVIRLTNLERERAGAPRLEANLLLTQAAEIRAREIARSFSHTRPNGSQWASVIEETGLSLGSWGENIAGGQLTAASVVSSWMGSPGHRENIVRQNFDQIGVAVYRDESGRLHWAQLFGG